MPWGSGRRKGAQRREGSGQVSGPYGTDLQIPVEPLPRVHLTRQLGGQLVVALADDLRQTDMGVALEQRVAQPRRPLAFIRFSREATPSSCTSFSFLSRASSAASSSACWASFCARWSDRVLAARASSRSRAASSRS